MYNLKIKSGEDIKITLGNSEIELSLEENAGNTVGKIEMGHNEIISEGFTHYRSKLDEIKISDTVVSKKSHKKKPLKMSEAKLGAFEFAKTLLPKPKGKRGRPKGKPRGPRKVLSSKRD